MICTKWKGPSYMLLNILNYSSLFLGSPGVMGIRGDKGEPGLTPPPGQKGESGLPGKKYF